MFLSVFHSINHIIKNRNTNILKALLKYFLWQIIKLLNFFPREIVISKSKIRIPDKNIANQGGAMMFTQGLYDYNNMKLVKLLLSEGSSVFVDIGANIGVYSLIASESKSANIFSFEPHPYTYKLLNDNVKLNARKNIQTINCALSNKNGTVSFSNLPGSSFNKIIQETENSNLLKVESIRFSDFVINTEIVPEITKIDVEGFEYDVLLGAKEILEKVSIIIVEISDNRNLIYQLLSDAGFIGPFNFNYAKKSFSYYNSSSLEDPIFISSSKMGILFANANLRII